MTRTNVESKTIKAVGYDHDSETMEIEYLDGTAFRYLMVPQFTHRALMAASDPGEFAAAHIIDGPYARARLAPE